MSSSMRVNRVESILLQELSNIIRNDMKDPRLEDVSITSVRVAGDLGHAWVAIASYMGDAHRDEAVAVLEKLAGRLRGEFGRRAHLRVAPELHFKADEGLEHGEQIYSILKQIEQEGK